MQNGVGFLLLRGTLAHLEDEELIKGVRRMASFFIKIYRWQSQPDTASAQPRQTSYIALISDRGSRQPWHMADTLFGLKKELGLIDVGDWEEIEREIAKNDYYALSR